MAAAGRALPTDTSWVDWMQREIQLLREWTEQHWDAQLSSTLREVSHGLPETLDVESDSEMRRVLLESRDFLCVPSPPIHDTPATIYTLTHLWAACQTQRHNVLFLVQLQSHTSKHFVPYLVGMLEVKLPIIAIALVRRSARSKGSKAVSSVAVTTSIHYDQFVIGQRRVEADRAADDSKSEASVQPEYCTVFSQAASSMYPLYHRLLDLCKSVGDQQFRGMTQFPGGVGWSGVDVAANFGTAEQTNKYAKVKPAAETQTPKRPSASSNPDVQQLRERPL